MEQISDTGADVSVISDKQFWTLQPTTLYPAKATFTGAGNQHLQVQGKFNATLTYKSRSSRQTIYVVKDLRRSLPGCPAIESLNLITRVGSIDDSSNDYITKYPKLFKRLGSLGEYTIKLESQSTSFTLCTPRRVPIPLMPKVKKELE